MLIRQPVEIEKFLRKHRHKFDTPQAYLGTELNTHKKDWNDPNIKLRVLLAAPWRYEDFRGNQTIPLLYQMLNDREDILCDRAFFPNTEKEYKLFCQYKIPIFGLETKRSMGEYDIVMTSLSFLPPWVNFPLMLDMSGIPSFVYQRGADFDNDYPLIMVGGSSMYGNFSIAYPVVDIVYLGDAEPGLMPLLDEIMISSNSSYLQPKFDYIFCTKMYAPIYDSEQFKGWTRLVHTVPDKLKIIRQKNLDDAPALTKPTPSYTDTTMGLGEIEVSRGCRANCVFCGIGWKYRPYRERSREKVVELMKENRKNSGAISLCPIATEFAYYSEKQGLIFDLMQEAEQVDPLSMRVDAFIDDPNFDGQLAERGMNQVALGVEAPSQRLRNRLQKGVTEEQILKACEIGLAFGFKRLKFFMISNIDEQPEDFEEFFNLLRKVRKLSVPYRDSTRTGEQIQIVASWTPWFIEPCVPVQWKKPTIEQRKDWKKVDDVIRGELGAKFKLGIKNAEDFLWTMQGMHLGDTRFADALVSATLRLKRPFYVSFTKKMKTELTECFKLTGYHWDYLMREREKDEVFPWDIVDRGVTKKALRNLYEKYVSGELDSRSNKIPMPSDKGKRRDYPKHHNEVDKNHWWIVKYKVTEDLEIVPNTYLKAVIHQAAFKTGFPLSVNSVRFFSDRDVRNWYGGFDFFVFGTLGKYPESRLFNFLPFLPFEFEKAEYLSPVSKSPYKFNKFVSEYVVEVDMPLLGVLDDWNSMVRKKSLMVSVPSTRYFSGSFSKKKIDIREEGVYVDLVNATYGGTPLTSVLILRLGHEVGIRYFLQALFPHAAASRIFRYKINKSGLFYPSGDSFKGMLNG